MDLTLLVESIIGLVILLGLLIFFLMISSRGVKKKSKKAIKRKERKLEVKYDIHHLKSIVKDRKSSTQELKKALDLVIKYHGKITKKLGLRPHPDSHVYLEILFNLCRHPNANKEIVINFDKELEKLNPSYKKEINDAMMRGLNSRGF